MTEFEIYAPLIALWVLIVVAFITEEVKGFIEQIRQKKINEDLIEEIKKRSAEEWERKEK